MPRKRKGRTEDEMAEETRCCAEHDHALRLTDTPEKNERRLARDRKERSALSGTAECRV